MRVLLTGAAGHIGRVVIDGLAGRYDWILTDRRPLTDTRGLPFVQADITEIDQLLPLCKDVETVLHLAAVPHDSAWQNLLPDNIVGAYNLFQAASEAGCKRVVYASSIQAVDGYPADVQVHVDMPVSPLTIYGATKAWGEALAAFYARQKNLSVICLRLGWVMPRNHPYLAPGASRLNSILTHPDLIRLIVAAIEAPDDLRFGIFNGLSNNLWKRLDITDSRTRLKYEPQDDAFALASRNYPGIMRRLGGRVKRALRSVVNGK